MRKDLDQQLVKAFPLLYRDRYLDRHTCRDTLMPYGFSCGDGWFQLIFDLSVELEPIVRSAARISGFKNFFIKKFNYIANLFGTKPIDLDDSVPRVVQAKEKLGGLRFYIKPTNSKIISIVSRYEALSYNICMKCGAKDGSLRKDRSWWLTLCEQCNRFSA